MGFGMGSYYITSNIPMFCNIFWRINIFQNSIFWADPSNFDSYRKLRKIKCYHFFSKIPRKEIKVFLKDSDILKFRYSLKITDPEKIYFRSKSGH